MSIIWIVVEADINMSHGSVQFTTVPFKPMLTGSMDNVEISGRSRSPEPLIKVNVVELTTIGADCREGPLEVLKVVNGSCLPCSLTTVNLHSMESTEAVHVRLT